LLPYLEQEGLFREYDSTRASSHQDTTYCCPGSYGPRNPPPVFVGGGVSPANAKMGTMHLSIFQCPSDSGNPDLPDNTAYGIDAGSGLLGAKTNYDFCTSSDYHCNAWSQFEAIAARRMFGENSTTRPTDVLDGTSHTIMLAETTMTVYNGRTPGWAYRGWVQVGVNPAATVINNWNYPINPPIALIVGRLGSWSWMGSLHPGGANCCFADGSVRFLSEDLDTTTLSHLAAMADGQTISDEP
jgi:prepilin-type processing-associated H-X9-DG protein